MVPRLAPDRPCRGGPGERRRRGKRRGTWSAPHGERAAPWWTAYALYREGEAALTRARGRETARGPLLRAHELATALEAAPLLGDIAALAARSRIDLATPEAVAASRPGRALPISQREQEVLVLLARGMTNKEIAAELFISEKTAAHHVEHIFTKLDVSSRVEAAGLAHQAGLVRSASQGAGSFGHTAWYGSSPT